MVDIVIGSIAPVRAPLDQPGPNGGQTEAEILHIRAPRQRVANAREQERRKLPRIDPPNSRVLTLLIPDGKVLPKDLDGKKYKLLIRFMKK